MYSNYFESQENVFLLKEFLFFKIKKIIFLWIRIEENSKLDCEKICASCIRKVFIKILTYF